jgi:purine-binding chemotaxis protein CheW
MASPTHPTDAVRWRQELLETLRADAQAPESELAGTRPAGSDRLEALAFEVAGETYALPLDAITEIVLPRPITPLPRTPAFVLGVMSLRGAVVPVLGLARRLGLPEEEPSRGTRILVLKDGEETMGCRIDRVQGVVRFVREELEKPCVAAGLDPRFLAGLGYDRLGNLMALLDAERLCDFELAPP